MKYINLIKRFYFLLDLIVFYIYDLFLSGLKIALDVITSRNLSNPRFVTLSIQSRSDIEITILANLITFSPGSIVVDVNEKEFSLMLHVMFRASDESIKRSILEKLEYRVLRVLRESL